MRRAIKRFLGWMIAAFLFFRSKCLGRQTPGFPRSVVVIANIGLGNGIMALPLLHSLKAHSSGIKVTVLTNASAAVIFRNTATADEVIILAPSYPGRLRQCLALRRQKPDLTLLTFPALALPDELLPLFIGSRHTVAHDYRPIQPFFHHLKNLYARLVPLVDQLHDVEQNLQLLPQGIAAVRDYPAIRISERAEEAAREVLGDWSGEARPLYVMHPGGKRGAGYKRWPAAKFRALADHLAETLDAKIIVLLGPDEAELQDLFHGPHLLTFCSSDLEIIIALLKKSHYFISNDSGIMHVASLVDISLFTIYGATNPQRNGAWGGRATNIYKKDISCRPCIHFIPSGAHLGCGQECLAGLSVNDVWNVIRAHQEEESRNESQFSRS